MRFLKSEYQKNFLILMGGMALAQAIPILFSPILTRLFDPSEFGYLATYNAIASFLIVIMSGRFELAIILPKRDEEAINILGLSVVVAAIILVFSSILFFGAHFFVHSFEKLSGIQDLLWLIPIGAFFVTVYTISNEWLVRKKGFKNLGTNRIVNTSGITASSLIFGFFKIFQGLIYGQLIGQFISSLVSLTKILKSDYHLIKYISVRKMYFFAKKYINFAKYNIPGQFINNLSGQLPILFLTYQFGVFEVGLFAFADRILGTPLGFLGNALKDVFKERAASDYKLKGNCIEIYKKTMLSLLGLSAIPFILLVLFAPTIFGYVFGVEWIEAGNYVRILSIMYIVSFLSMPTSWMFVIAEKQKLDLLWQILFITFTLVGLVVGVLLNDVYLLLLSFSISRSLVYLIQIFMTYKMAKGNLNDR